MQDFDYEKDKRLNELKQICNNCNSRALKKSFEYLRILFYFTDKKKILAKYIPNVAYIVATISKNHIRIVDLAVDLKNQRKGIGKTLVNYVIEQAKKMKIKKITLRTSSEETAFMFYHKLGFKDIKMNNNDIEMERLV